MSLAPPHAISASMSNMTSSNGNIYVGSTVSAGYPVDLIGTSGNILTSGNVCAGNIGMFRNRIINGNMSINQRGITTSAFVTNN